MAILADEDLALLAEPQLAHVASIEPDGSGGRGVRGGQGERLPYPLGEGAAELVDEGADAHIDRMAKKYPGQDTYPFRRAGEERVIVRIRPSRKLGRG